MAAIQALIPVGVECLVVKVVAAPFSMLWAASRFLCLFGS